MVSVGQRHRVNLDPIASPHIVLLEFREDGQDVIIRAAVNTEDVEYKGETYVAAGINVRLPSAQNDEAAASLSASNSDRRLGRAVDNAKQRINVRIMLIDVGVPDVPIIDTLDLLVANASSLTGEKVELMLGTRATMQEPVPIRRTTRNSFPGVWTP